MRLRKKWWARPEMEESEQFVTRPHECSGKWNVDFDNNNPIHLELGCGRGKFITEKAALSNDKNFIGIDLKDEVLIYALRKVQIDELLNVRIVPLNISFIDGIFAENEVERIFINFCNPWPKERHKKRRLTHSGFLGKYKNFLVPSGEIWFKTDNKELFAESLEYFIESSFEIKFKTYDLHNSGFSENIITEYEAKFTSLGMKTMFLIAKRIEG